MEIVENLVWNSNSWGSNYCYTDADGNIGRLKDILSKDRGGDAMQEMVDAFNRAHDADVASPRKGV